MARKFDRGNYTGDNPFMRTMWNVDTTRTKYRVYCAPQKPANWKNMVTGVKNFTRGQKTSSAPSDIRSADSNGFINYRDIEIDHSNEIEENGLYSVNLEPEARVFICGTEIHSCSQVTISTHMNTSTVTPSTCRIQLQNINNKYRITRQNLRDIWEDYEEEKKIIFKLKVFSLRPVFVENPIFGINDPIVIFLKDRFTPFWRFAFTGYITSLDDLDGFNNDVLTIGCEDVTKFIQMKKYNINPAIFNATHTRLNFLGGESTQPTAHMYSGKDAVTTLTSLFFGPRAGEKPSTSEKGQTYGSITMQGKTSMKVVLNFFRKKGIGNFTENQLEEWNQVTVSGKRVPNEAWRHYLGEPNAEEVKRGIKKGSWQKGFFWYKDKLFYKISSNDTTAPGINTQDFIFRDDDREIDDTHYKKLSLTSDTGTALKQAQIKSQFIPRKQRLSIKGDTSSGVTNFGGRKKWSFNYGPLEDVIRNENPIIDLLRSNIGFFRMYIHIVQGISEDTARTFAKEVESSLPSAPIYEELPRYFITRLSWVDGEYVFDVTGCQGLNPLVTDDFVDQFELGVQLIASIERGVGTASSSNTKDLFFKKMLDKGLEAENPLPYDFVKMNVLGSNVTCLVNQERKNSVKKVVFNPRVIVVMSKMHTSSPIAGLKWRTFELAPNSTEGVSDIISQILLQTDTVCWVSPMGDFVIEPYMYDTNPWDWEERQLGQLPRSSFATKQSQKGDLEDTGDVWIFSQNSFLNQVVEFRDETQATTSYDSKKFTSLIEVIGTPVGMIDTIDEGTLRELANIHAEVPYFFLVKDGFSPDQSVQELKDMKIKDLLDFIQSKKYSPEQNFVKEYGYKAYKTPSTIRGLNSREACKEYAEILSNRFLTEAYSMRDISIFGRPGILPNRPIYLRSKDSIITPLRITTTLAYGSEYKTVIQSGFLRNQSFMDQFTFTPIQTISSDTTSVGTSTFRTGASQFVTNLKGGENTQWLNYPGVGDLLGRGASSQQHKFPRIGLVDWNRGNFITQKEIDALSTYQVQKGDTVEIIASKNNISVNQLEDLNKELLNERGGEFWPGDIVNVDPTKSTPKSTKNVTR